MNPIQKLGSAVAFASAVALVPTSAFAFLDFQVDESAVPGVVNGEIFWADKINGFYTELLTINDDFSFSTIAFANLTAFVANDGTQNITVSDLNGRQPSGYGMYAVFESSGFFNPLNGSFSGSDGSFSLFLDLENNTKIEYGADASLPYSLLDTSDDYAIGFASNIIRAVGLPGTPGAFDLIWDDFSLVSDESAPIDGNRFFIQPRPFHVTLQVNGDFDEDNFKAGTFNVTGDLSAVFTPLEVPEPGTLALLGLAFAGLGFTTLRRKS